MFDILVVGDIADGADEAAVCAKGIDVMDGVDHFSQMGAVITGQVVDGLADFQAGHGWTGSLVDPVKVADAPSDGVVDPQIVNSGLGIIHVKDNAMGVGDHDPLVKLIQHRQQGHPPGIDVRKKTVDFGSLHKPVLTTRRDKNKAKGKGNSCACIIC